MRTAPFVVGILMIGLAPPEAGAHLRTGDAPARVEAASGGAAYAALRLRKRAKEQTGSNSSGGQIACTPTGCAPVPPGCRIETGFSQDGMLSGYDSVLCPVR